MLSVARLILVDEATGASRVSWGAFDEKGVPDPTIERFVQDLELRGRSPNTVRSYVRSAASLTAYCGRSGIAIECITRKQFVGWLRWMSAPGENVSFVNLNVGPRLRAASFNTYYEGAKAFLSFALNLESEDIPLVEMPKRLAHAPVARFLAHVRGEVGGRLRKDPYRQSDPATGGPKRRLSRQEVEAITGSCRNLRDIALVLTMHGSGLRIGEALGLKIEDILSGERVLRIVPRQNPNGARVKRGKGRSVPVTDAVVACLEEWISSEDFPFESGTDYVFVSFKDGKPLSSTTATSLRKHLIKRSNVDFDWHDFRHTHASELLALGHSIAAVSIRLGHSDPSFTAQTYIHLLPAEQRALTRRFFEKHG